MFKERIAKFIEDVKGKFEGVASGARSSFKLTKNVKAPVDGNSASILSNQIVRMGLVLAGEKLAEFALKEAENMSPVLEVDPGVVVMPHILKGFYVGEKGMMKKLNEFREKQQKQKSSTRNNQKNG